MQNVSRGVGTHELNQANVAHVGRENIQKVKQSGEVVNNTGFAPGTRLLNSRIQIGEDEGRNGGMRGGIGETPNSTALSASAYSDASSWRKSGSALSNMPVSLFPCALQASGTPFDQLAPDMYTYDPWNVDQGLVRGDARKIFAVDMSGGAKTAVQGPARVGAGIAEYQPTDKQVLGTGVEFGFVTTAAASAYKQTHNHLGTTPRTFRLRLTAFRSGATFTLTCAPRRRAAWRQ